MVTTASKRRKRQVEIEIDFEPHEYQTRVLMSPKLTRVAVTGARGGKTKMGAVIVMQVCITQPTYIAAEWDYGTPYKVFVGAPTYGDIDKVIRPEVLRAIPEQLKIGPYHHTRKQQVIRGLHGQTILQFVTAGKVESWLGEKLHFAWIDEFAQIKEEMFDEVHTRLTPLVGQRRGGLLLTGTPRGPNWAFRRIFKPWTAAQKIKNDGGRLSPHHPARDIDFFTWRTIDNPYIPPEEIAHYKEIMPKRYFRRTFEASWDAFTGQIFEDFRPQVHVRRARDFTFVLPSGRLYGDGPTRGRLVDIVAGVDWGYAEGHPGAIVVCGRDDLGRWWVIEESVAENVLVDSRRLSDDTWVTRARALNAKYHISTFYCDSAEPAYIRSFRLADLIAVGANKNVLEGIQTMAESMFVRELPDGQSATNFFILDCCNVTTEEIQFYHWEEHRERPVKKNDHAIDAVRYAMHTWRHRGSFDRELGYDAA